MSDKPIPIQKTDCHPAHFNDGACGAFLNEVSSLFQNKDAAINIEKTYDGKLGVGLQFEFINGRRAVVAEESLQADSKKTSNGTINLQEFDKTGNLTRYESILPNLQFEKYK